MKNMKKTWKPVCNTVLNYVHYRELCLVLHLTIADLVVPKSGHLQLNQLTCYKACQKKKKILSKRSLMTVITAISVQHGFLSGTD